MARKRGNPTENTVSRVGNYSTAVDTAGLDPEMKGTLRTRKMSEKEYLTAQKARVNAFRKSKGKQPL